MREYFYKCMFCGLVTTISEEQFRKLPIDGSCNLCGKTGSVFVRRLDKR